MVKMPACFACFVALALTAVAVGHRKEVLKSYVACSANGGSLTLVSATGAGGHCKGKRELFIAEGKRLRCVGLCCKQAASSLRLRL